MEGIKAELAEVMERLGRPFPKEAIKSRPGGGGVRLSYVEGHTVIHRLNEATEGRWNFSIQKEWQEGDLLKCIGRLDIPGLGYREHVGVQTVQGRGGEDLHKGHVTDALKKCATLFGVGLELYGPDYGELSEEQLKANEREYLRREIEDPNSAHPVAVAARDSAPGPQFVEPATVFCEAEGCGYKMTQKQAAWCRQKFGRPLCPKHQKEEVGIDREVNPETDYIHSPEDVSCAVCGTQIPKARVVMLQRKGAKRMTCPRHENAKVEA